MKLFHRLLVAPAALGLLAPMSAGASEVNLNDISNYSDVESIDFANSFYNSCLGIVTPSIVRKGFLCLKSVR